MKTNPWFRMYAEFLTDPKVQMLQETDQRRYIMLLCMRCSNGDVTLQDVTVAFQLRISEDDWKKTKALLIDKNLIDDDNKPIAWERRQYVSDTSNQRVARFRERQKNEQQECNVTVTPPDTETDTETDKKKVPPNPQTGELAVSKKTRSKQDYSESFENFWKSYPSPAASSKSMAWKAWARMTDCERTAAAGAVSAYNEILRAKPDRPACHAATFLNQRRWETVGTAPAKSVEFWWKDKTKVAGMTVERWRAGIEKFANGTWPIEHLGFWPGHDKCIVPECLIKELQLGDKYDSGGYAKGEWKKQQDQKHGDDH